MTDGGVTIVGLPQFLKYLRGVGAVDLPKQIRLANLTASKLMAAKIAAAAPRGGQADPHPGKLAASVRPRATQRKASVVIGKGTLYAKPIIFGWRKHNIKANPFPYRVIDAEHAVLVSVYHAAVRAAIRSKQ